MQVTIPNRLTEIYEVENRLLGEVAQAGFDENSRFSIRLALDEALINGYKHGNKQDESRQLVVEWDITPQTVTVSVEDEGNGFNYRQLLDPRSVECLQRTNGRGIFLIRQFMNSVEFHGRGNRISFTFLRKDNLDVNSHGMVHWDMDNIKVLELDPAKLERNPLVMLESVIDLLEKGYKDIVLDLRFLDQVESSVIGCFVACAREVESNEGRLVFVRPQPDVERVLRTTCLDSYLHIYGELNLAMKYFQT